MVEAGSIDICIFIYTYIYTYIYTFIYTYIYTNEVRGSAAIRENKKNDGKMDVWGESQEQYTEKRTQGKDGCGRRYRCGEARAIKKVWPPAE